MQSVRDHSPASFTPAKSTMQLFMRQSDVIGVALYVKICLEFLVAAPDAHDDASDPSSSALAAR